MTFKVILTQQHIFIFSIFVLYVKRPVIFWRVFIKYCTDLLYRVIQFVFRSSIIIPIVNSGTSIWAGFVVFSVLGFAAERAGVPVSEVATAGPGLAFITYPAAVTLMPAPNFWAITFFVMLFFLGIDTMVNFSFLHL